MCISNWRHVTTKQNPADLVSRGTTPAALVRSEIWLTGPDFLKDDPQNWPDPGVACSDVDPTVFEKSSNALAFAVVDEEDCIEQLIARFSCLRKLKVAVAWLQRFIVFLCRRRMPNLELKKEPISVEELTAAEITVVRIVQRQNFARWMIESTGGGQLLKLRNESSPVMKLDPVLIDNVLRVGGRLDKAPLSYDARHPAILPHRGGARGVPGEATAPPNFACPPSGPPKIFRVTSCHWSRSLSESPTQTIHSSPCCKTGPSSGPFK